MVEVGTKIGDRYKIIGEIGHGGMANVYLAQDLILDREVAVKVLRYDFQNDHVAIRRFQREALAATELVHPNIVQVYDVGEENGMQYIVMEYVKGMDLKEYIKRHYPIPYAKVVDIMEQILSAVTLAHQHQIIHRDIKPQNILINEDGVVKITDFGIAIALSETSITQTNTLLGSVHYLSPEQARGGMATSQSDIYALGIVLYELLTGAVPFEGESAVSIALKHFQSDLPSIRDVDPRIPQPLENVVLKATAKEPADRYQSTREMANDLSTCLSPERRNEPKFVPVALIAETKVMTVPQEEESKQSEKTKAEENQEAKAVSSEKKKPTKKQTKKKKNSGVKMLLGVVVALLVIVVGFFLYMILSTPRTISVPDVSSQTVEEASKELESANLKVKTETVSFASQDIAEGLVVKTSPEKNTKVKENAEVTLYVSSGGEKSKLADYTTKNMTFDEAKQELVRLGFKEANITKKEETSDSVDEGVIISQSPSAGTEVDPSTEVVELTVSKGAETFELRDMSGYSKSEVQNYLEGRGLSLSATTAYSDDVQKNYVISTSPGAGSSVKNGDTITVVFSDGPEPVSSESSSSSSSSSSSTSQSGAIVKTATVVVTVPNNGATSNIKIYIGDATRSINNVDKSYTLNPTDASLKITAALQLREGQSGDIKITRDDVVIYDVAGITESYSETAAN